MTRGKAKLLRNLIEQLAITLDDATALTDIELFPTWGLISYSIGDRVQYNGTLYKCIQAHTAQSDWTPDATPALWVVVSIDKWPEWVQPTGAQDAYAKDSKVTHNGKKWISSYDANVWEPGVYGWEEYKD